MDQILSNLELLWQFPVYNFKIIVDGIMIGAIFALSAYGLALVWGVMNVKNLAQGDFVIAGGYIAWQFWQHHWDRLGRLILCDTRAASDTAAP